MRITVDRTKCSALGMCEATAPEYFEINDDGDLTIQREDVPESARKVLEQAVAGCPTRALALEDP